MIHFDTAILLAGGKSSRMGFDKQFLEVNNNRIVDLIIEQLNKLFKEIIIVTHKPEEYVDYPYRIVEDEIVGYGPLSGIHAGLKNSYSSYNYITCCDMPYINTAYIIYMMNLIKQAPEEVDAVITQFGKWIEPFNSFYHRKLLQNIEMNLNHGKRRIWDVLEISEVLYVPEEEARKFSPLWEMFMNINTLEDLENYKNRRN